MKEWTQAAEDLFAGTVARRRVELGAGETVDEATMRSEVEAILSAWNVKAVDSADVSRALVRLGYLAAEDAIPSRRRWRWLRPLAGGWLFFVTIVLPVITLGVEMATGMCGAAFFDPIPTWLHMVVIATVPISGFYAWWQGRQTEISESKWLPMAIGSMLSISLCYAILFSTITPMGIIALGFVWYMGIGFIGLLPLTPLFALLGSIQQARRTLKRRSTKGGGRSMLSGFVLGLVVLLIISAPLLLTRVGLMMVSSEDAGTQSRGIRLLRSAASTDSLGRALVRPAWGTDLQLFNDGGRPLLGGQTAAEIFYKVTGEPFFQGRWQSGGGSRMFGGSSWRDDGFDFDSGQGGDAVGGFLKGLSLSDSRVDGTVDADAGFAYLEWILVFKNSSSVQREARARIAIPPGSVASRVTLWIDGEEREAAVGSRAATKQAYRRVVQRRRDPILVTTCGPDRLLLQCFPVPPGGEMKVKLGVTIPLTAAGSNASEGQLGLPVFVERNFKVAPKQVHSIWLTSTTPVVLDERMAELFTTTPRGEDGAGRELQGDVPNTPLLMSRHFLSATRSRQLEPTWCSAIGNDTYVVQRIVPSAVDEGRDVVLALDTSVTMGPHLKSLADAMGSIPERVRFAVVASTDGEPVVITPLTVSSATARDAAARAVRALACEGGRPHLPMLGEAYRLVASAEDAAIVWIHAPVPVRLGAIEGIRQKLERAQGNVVIYDLQIGVGPNKIAEHFDGMDRVRSLRVSDSPVAELVALLGSEQDAAWQWTREQVVAPEGPPAGSESSRHLARLWANDEVRRLCSQGEPGASERALALAGSYAIVTPISGAVVLENAQQYEEAGLVPVAAADVPTVPEPEIWVLLGVAGVLLIVRTLGRRVRS